MQLGRVYPFCVQHLAKCASSNVGASCPVNCGLQCILSSHLVQNVWLIRSAVGTFIADLVRPEHLCLEAWTRNSYYWCADAPTNHDLIRIGSINSTAFHRVT